MSTTTYRYQLPRKAIKIDCPSCGLRHRKTLSRYVDTQTGEPLPLPYGRCDRESNCAYHLSPYQKGASGMSFADEQRQYQAEATPIPKAWFRLARNRIQTGMSRHEFIRAIIREEGATLAQAEHVTDFIYGGARSATAFRRPAAACVERPVFTIPHEVFLQSLGHNHQNQFARLLGDHFGLTVANDLLSRFQIGTSSYWPGACVFWYIDEEGRKRGGQIKLFDANFHTVKYLDASGVRRTKTNWVHSAYARRCHELKVPYPPWLVDYLDEQHEVAKSPCLFGLPQLLNAPLDQPVAIVESPKTAVLCSPYFPGFIWLAVGALSYLNASRLAPLRNRNVMLFPDLSTDGSAFDRWSRTASELTAQGFSVRVSDYLALRATQAQQDAGFDLADYLLGQWPGYPPDWD